MNVQAATSFLDVARVASAIAGTSKRLEKRRVAAEFLRRLRRDEVAPAVLFLTGSIFAESDGRVLKIGHATIQSVLALARETPTRRPSLTLLDVEEHLHAIAEVHGPDSLQSRQKLLNELIARATPLEQEFLLRGLSGEMRIGLNESGMLDAVAEASGIPSQDVREAQMLLGDLGRIAETALYDGLPSIRSVRLRVLFPVKPMLAEAVEDPDEVLATHGGKTAVEYKMDGARVQIHRLDDEVRIFSRRLSDVTRSLPEIVELARTIPSRSFVMEGEVLAIDSAGRPLPFQELMRRFGRVHEVETHRQTMRLELRLFDLLHLDGKTVMELPYQDRFAALAMLVPPALLVERHVTTSRDEIARFLKSAIDSGHEGLVAKRLDAPYTAGKRGKNWLKIKPSDTLDVILLAAEWGHGRRRGTLSNYWLGVRHGDGWEMIGKTFKGLTDLERVQLMEQLLALKVSEEPGVVHVRPEVVVEVEYNDVQKSPTYSSGFALRFARVKRIRRDKGPLDADTYETLKALYEKQFERKGRAGNSA